MTQSLVTRAFIGGELAPALYARADQAKYLSGLSLCRNFIVQRHGGVTKRPGFRYVAAVKTAAKASKLRKFVFEGDDQTYLLEFGDLYVRFFWHGAPVVVTGVTAWSNATAYVVGDLASRLGVNYYCILAHTNHQPPNATYWYALTSDIFEVPTPYAIADVARLHVTQSADVLTITHPSYVPYELQRLGHTDWALVALTTAPTIGPPTAALAGVAGAAGALTMKYVIVSAKSSTYEKSYPSVVITIAACAAPTPALPNSLSWTAVSGVAEYYVYLDPTASNGIYGFIGVAIANSFKDPGYQPDYTQTPPVTRTLFASTNNYPGTAAYYQQRLWLARTKANPENVEGSQVGAYHNFATSVPLEDDDAISFNLAGNHLNPVAHLVGLRLLVILTDEGEWVVKGDEAGAIRPTAINAVQIGDIGASVTVRPEIVSDSIVYAQALGTGIRALDFDQQQGGFTPTDLTILASHLFDGYTITDLAYAQTPQSVLWVVRSDGVLLGLTYVKEQDVWAWHQHTTAAGGLVESIAVLPDTTAKRDVLYAVIKRTINSATVRYIEKLDGTYNENTDDLADAFYVDCGLTYDGAPATVLSGLGHLEGQRVAVLGDGAVVTTGSDSVTLTVTAGAITLPAARSTVQIGLPITADLQTLDLDVEGSSVRDKRKRVQGLTALVAGSARGFLAGPDADHLIAEQAEPWETATVLLTGPTDLNLTCGWDQRGRVYMRQNLPLPFTVLGLIPQVGIGG